MPKQPEQILEEQLVEQLQRLNYGLVLIRDEKELIANLKSQLEKHNNISFSATEFEKVLNILSKGSVFEKAKTLREKQHIVKDNGDNLYFELIQTEHWCQNQFQVTHQVAMEGKYKVSKRPGTYCSLVSLRLPLAKIFKDERAENIDNSLGNDGATTNKRAYGSGVLFS